MLNESFLYGKEAGLFRQVLRHSSVIEGRYHVSPNFGHDLNTGNLQEYLKGLPAGQKYPMAVLLPPRSKPFRVSDHPWEEFYFTLFFLTTAVTDGQGQARVPHIPADWARMKACALSFLSVLREVCRRPDLRGAVSVDERTEIVRVSRLLNDRLNGVGLSFVVQLDVRGCERYDYTTDDVAKIVVPDPENDYA